MAPKENTMNEPKLKKLEKTAHKAEMAVRKHHGHVCFCGCEATLYKAEMELHEARTFAAK